MNLLYIHQHFSLPTGSTGNRSYYNAMKLVRNGHDVTMICGRYNMSHTGLNGKFINGIREGNHNNLRIIEIDLFYENRQNILTRSYIFFKFALLATYISLIKKYHLVFATSTPLTTCIPALITKYIRGTPYIFEVRDLWPELPKQMKVINNPIVLSVLNYLEYCAYNNASSCISLSPGITSGIKRKLFKNINIKMVPNGSDISLFNDPDINSIRPPQVPEDALLLIYSGTHGVANGLDYLIDVAEIIKHNNIFILLIGDGKCKPSLMKKVTELNLNNVIFLDPMPKPKLACYLKGADLGVQSLANIPGFYYGTSPNKFFDYISTGLPVINNYPGWLADLINKYNFKNEVRNSGPSL